jgi:ferrous iron transport protein B
MVLGLGCDTMATMVTRTLETKRERIIATFLLALGVPCSAQQAVFVGILSQNSVALLLWIGVVACELLLVGYLSARVLPGNQPSFYMEVPPLRFPKITSVLRKTYSRMQWYLLEILPLFVIASVFIWIGRLTKIFDLVIAGLQPIVRMIGLPNNVTEPILYGFFRRDYAAASLYDEATGATGLTGNEFLVAAIVLTLFLPCIAQFLIMAKERGIKTTLIMAGAILILAFGTGFLLNTGLNVLGVNLSFGG